MASSAGQAYQLVQAVSSSREERAVRANSKSYDLNHGTAPSQTQSCAKKCTISAEAPDIRRKRRLVPTTKEETQRRQTKFVLRAAAECDKRASVLSTQSCVQAIELMVQDGTWANSVALIVFFGGAFEMEVLNKTTLCILSSYDCTSFLCSARLLYSEY